MLQLSYDEWSQLSVHPTFSKFMRQLQKEVEFVQDRMGEGDLLSQTADATAIDYAANVGRVRALKELINYEPAEEES